MGQQSVRQAARRAALGVQASRREARARRERRLDQLAVELHTALGERDAAVTAIERRAGEVLQAMTSDEGLTLREAVDWCGGLTLKEASRLLRMAPDEAARFPDASETADGERRYAAPAVAVTACGIRWCLRA